MTASNEIGSVLHLLRVTIEAVSPLSCGSGDRIEMQRRIKVDGTVTTQDGFEVALLRDANGLPAIPGASLQGILRRFYAGEHGLVKAEKIFGFADGEDGEAARLFVGFGCVHGADDVAVVGLFTQAVKITGDPILKALHGDAPVVRDHVKLNERHVADGRAMFNNSLF